MLKKEAYDQLMLNATSLIYIVKGDKKTEISEDEAKILLLHIAEIMGILDAMYIRYPAVIQVDNIHSCVNRMRDYLHNFGPYVAAMYFKGLHIEGMFENITIIDFSRQSELS